MPRSDFSSSSGLKKLYGNVLIDPPNGFDRSGEFVIVITSCRSASRRCAMYLPEKPKAPVTATRTLAPNPVGRTFMSSDNEPPDLSARLLGNAVKRRLFHASGPAPLGSRRTVPYGRQE